MVNFFRATYLHIKLIGTICKAFLMHHNFVHLGLVIIVITRRLALANSGLPVSCCDLSSARKRLTCVNVLPSTPVSICGAHCRSSGQRVVVKCQIHLNNHLLTVVMSLTEPFLAYRRSHCFPDYGPILRPGNSRPVPLQNIGKKRERRSEKLGYALYGDGCQLEKHCPSTMATDMLLTTQI